MAKHSRQHYEPGCASLSSELAGYLESSSPGQTIS